MEWCGRAVWGGGYCTDNLFVSYVLLPETIGIVLLMYLSPTYHCLDTPSYTDDNMVK